VRWLRGLGSVRVGGGQRVRGVRDDTYGEAWAWVDVPLSLRWKNALQRSMRDDQVMIEMIARLFSNVPYGMTK
jgi:hypothetical protein